MNKRDAYLWLKSIDKVTDKVITSIQENGIEIEKLMDYSNKEILEIKNINLNIKENIVKYKSHEYLDKIKGNINKTKTNYICIEDKNYPKNLKNIYNPPKILFYKGNIDIINENINIAMVGARKCTQYGSNCAKKIGKELSEYDINIISGLAIGIDYYSHIGCLEGSSKAVAILGSPVDNILPRTNLKLADKILEDGGVIISEFYTNDKVYPSNFVQRNRIISGISDGIVVVEAAKKSGSLITVDYGLEQGKNIFAVPGNINSCMSEGCHNIIKLGAKLINNVEDILEEYNIMNSIKQNNEINKLNELSPQQKLIINEIKNKGTLNIDEICDNTNINIKNMNVIINELIINDLIIENDNNNYSLNT